MQDLEVWQPELDHVIHPRNHVQLERHIRRQSRADLRVFMCLTKRHETLKLLWNEGASGLQWFAKVRGLYPLYYAGQLVDATHAH